MPSLRHAAPLLLLLLAGCAHTPELKQTTEPAPPGGSSAAGGAAALRTRSVQIYVDTTPSESASATDPGWIRAETFALVLRDRLGDRGFEVRSAEAHPPPGNAGTAAVAITRLIADGSPPPTTTRALAYLHPNAPRLLLMVGIEKSPGPAAMPGRDGPLLIGALLADTTDGSILWSHRLVENLPTDDRQLRRLADQLLVTLPTPPPQA